ncbi:HyaD/HybD family hydrogenase maturation endopeptidase [Microaerobacter geothermalis]|uniref:HyaD/HybD family hydrogenase maturation endopeptidase n=1 Tax=Microaerobacter geothermalis TaxID=674972 RepID=UPI001F34B67B|nr:HyaD/HybD family hydrogenase maturation endopeptidase [Microaerobacter geothermalis]MCF6092735.1 HyaD/HybD family hydrogenase maturation endopeptidase [Microaerobacter geothermalis]
MIIKPVENKITILGIGNPLFTDEGVGVHTLSPLRKVFADQDDIEIIDGGTDGLRLLGPVEETDYLLIIDAINAGKEPGTLITLEGEEIPKYLGVKMSFHQLGFQEVLAMAKFRGSLPKEMFMCGIQPKSLEWGAEMTETVAKQLPKLVEMVVDKVKQWRSYR